MTSMFEQTLNYLVTLPGWELIAVATGFSYTVLAARENIWCWPAALVSTIIYTVIFYDVYLWMDSFLQVYYLAMAIYGWHSWRRTPKTDRVDNAHQQSLLDTKQDSIKQDKNVISGLTNPNNTIVSWSLEKHVKCILALAVISLMIGYLMDNFTPTHFPYVDSATTVFAIFATYLVTQKVLENWLYWFVIDLVSIYLYIEKGLIPTAGLFVVYVVIVIFGYFSWRSRLQANTAKLSISQST